MGKKFIEGRTYKARGYSSNGSVLCADISKVRDGKAWIFCDILYGGRAVRRNIRIDEEGNEYVNLDKNFTLSSADGAAEQNAIHEAQRLQDDILRDDVKGDWRVYELMEDVMDGIDNGVPLMQVTGRGYDVSDEDWAEEEDDSELENFIVSEMEWTPAAPVNIPKQVQISLPVSVIDTEEEIDAVQEAVIDELRRRGAYFNKEDMDGITLEAYSLEDAPTYDFSEEDLELGLSGAMSTELTPVNSVSNYIKSTIL